MNCTLPVRRGVAVDDVDVAAEVCSLDRAEPGLGLHDQLLRTGGPFGRRRPAAPRRSDLAIGDIPHESGCLYAIRAAAVKRS
jgi:hypothetical protein